MVKIFEFKAGSFISEPNKVIGTPTDAVFKRKEKGVAVVLESGKSITWTIPSSSITNIISWVGGNGTLRVSCGANNTDIAVSGLAFKNNVVSFSGITTITLTATTGTVYLFKLELHNVISALDLLNSEKQFLQATATEKPVRNFDYPEKTSIKEEGLVAAYSFSPQTVSNGTLLDISGNANHGTISGALLTKEGMKFDGVNSSINCGDNMLSNAPQSQVTWCFRFLRKSYTENATIISKYEGAIAKRSWNIRELTNGGVGVSLSENGTSFNSRSFATGFFEDDKWINGVLIFNNGTLTIYKQGVLFDTTVATETVLFNNVTQPAIIGAYLTNFFNGEISDIKIYNYALTPEQAKAYHNSFIKPQLLEDFSNNSVGDTL